MTETTPTTYVIPMPHLGKLKAHYRIDRDALVGMINDIETMFFAADVSGDCVFGDEPHGDEHRIDGYITGTTTSLHHLSDQELLKLWNEDSFKRLALLQRVDWDLAGYPKMEHVPKAEVEAALAEQQRERPPAIEGREDGELIEIGRDALIRRLVTFHVERDIQRLQEALMTGMIEGMVGYNQMRDDDLLKQWEEIRGDFYARVFDTEALPVDRSDPEYEDLVNSAAPKIGTP